jgi:putative SOS response-associated peptidase YedK
MADRSAFAVAGLWRSWEGEAGPETSFTQLTMNADDHPLMRRFHKPGDEKRALVIVPKDEWDDWQLADGSRLPPSFTTFDFFDESTGDAISAKTLDTTTPVKVNDPLQVYKSCWCRRPNYP